MGYHLYAQQGYTADPVADERAVRTVFTRYLDQMHVLVRAEEGRDKPLFVSEAGWNSDPDPKLVRARETFQAQRARAWGSDVLARIRWWSWASAFCTQDFYNGDQPRFYGLYRMGDVETAGRKPAYNVLRGRLSAICSNLSSSRRTPTR